MARTKKTLRLRGSRTNGKGRNFKTGAGFRGGTGKAGSLTHKYLHYLLIKRKLHASRTAINLNIIESKLPYFIKKKYLRLHDNSNDEKTYKVTALFCKKYKKILSNGECSIKILPTKNIKFSKRALKKLL